MTNNSSLGNKALMSISLVNRLKDNLPFSEAIRSITLQIISINYLLLVIILSQMKATTVAINNDAAHANTTTLLLNVNKFHQIIILFPAGYYMNKR